MPFFPEATVAALTKKKREDKHDNNHLRLALEILVPKTGCNVPKLTERVIKTLLAANTDSVTTLSDGKTEVTTDEITKTDKEKFDEDFKVHANAKRTMNKNNTTSLNVNFDFYTKQSFKKLKEQVQAIKTTKTVSLKLRNGNSSQVDMKPMGYIEGLNPRAVSPEAFVEQINLDLANTFLDGATANDPDDVPPEQQLTIQLSPQFIRGKSGEGNVETQGYVVFSPAANLKRNYTLLEDSCVPFFAETYTLFIPFRLRNENPQAFGESLMKHNESINQLRNISVAGINEKLMEYENENESMKGKEQGDNSDEEDDFADLTLYEKLQDLEGVVFVHPTKHTMSKGKWNIICFKQNYRRIAEWCDEYFKHQIKVDFPEHLFGVHDEFPSPVRLIKGEAVKEGTKMRDNRTAATEYTAYLSSRSIASTRTSIPPTAWRPIPPTVATIRYDSDEEFPELNKKYDSSAISELTTAKSSAQWKNHTVSDQDLETIKRNILDEVQQRIDKAMQTPPELEERINNLETQIKNLQTQLADEISNSINKSVTRQMTNIREQQEIQQKGLETINNSVATQMESLHQQQSIQQKGIDTILQSVEKLWTKLDNKNHRSPYRKKRRQIVASSSESSESDMETISFDSEEKKEKHKQGIGKSLLPSFEEVGAPGKGGRLT